MQLVLCLTRLPERQVKKLKVMIVYQVPTSSGELLYFLTKTVKTGEKDIAAGRNYLDQDIIDQIILFLPDYKEKNNIVSAFLAGREKEVREKNVSVKKLITCTQDLWEVLKRRVKRNEEPNEVLTYYQLPLDGDVPKIGASESNWVEMAGRVQQGDAEAVKAGFEPMVNPSAADLKKTLQKAKKEIEDVAPADRAYDEAQEAVEALNPQAYEFEDEVMAQLRYKLRKKDKPSQRRIMRTYGSQFKTLPGATKEEEAELSEIME